jgi:Ca2+-binding EF-hand superfamily protein
MLGSVESGDVVLRAEGRPKLHAHRAVLAGWSRVLRAAVRHSERHALDLMYEGDPEALDSMLRAFYTGYVDVDVSQDGSATALLAISLAYDVPALVTRLSALLDANRSREQWWSELQDQLREIHGDGSIDDVWQRAEQLEQKLPDAVDRRTHESIRSGRLRINLRAEVVRIVASLFDERLTSSDESLSDTVLSVPMDQGTPKDFRTHRGVLGHWSGVLQKKLLQKREDGDGLHEVAHHSQRECKVNLEFRLRSHTASDGAPGGIREAIVVEQLLRTFYTGLLQLSSAENAKELLQAAVAFEVPIVERAARTWLMARAPHHHDEPTVVNVHSVPPAANRRTHQRLLQGSSTPNPPPLRNQSGLQQIAVGSGMSHLEEVYDRLDRSKHGLSLHEVEDAIREICPDLFASDQVEHGREQEAVLHGNETTGHGIDLYMVSKGVYIINGIKPGSAAAADPKLKTGMQLLKINGERVDSIKDKLVRATKRAGTPDLLHHKLARADLLHQKLTEEISSGKSVRITVKASKSSQRDWSVPERMKALQWAYRAADEHEDGWISLQEFEQFHAFLRYVYENFTDIQLVLDRVGSELTSTKFQQACSIISHTYWVSQDFEKLCELPTAIASDTANTRDFITWLIRKNAGEKQTRLETTHEFVFDKPGASGIALVRRTDEKRGVEIAQIKSIQQGSDAEAHPGLRVGLILTSISSPALSTKQSKSEQFLDWISSENVNVAAKMAEGAAERIKQLHELERSRLREVCMKTGLLAEGSRIGWDGLCHLGFEAVDNLLKQLFSTAGSTPITLGFADGRHNLLFPGKKRCDDAFDLLSHRGSTVSLEAIETALRGHTAICCCVAQVTSDPEGRAETETRYPDGCIVEVLETRLVDGRLRARTAHGWVWYVDREMKTALKDFSLFAHTADDMPHKTIMQAYRAADARGDGCLSKGEFRKCVQFLVYFHNNEHEFEEIEEEATDDRRQSFEMFENSSLKMGEHMTHAEAVAEFNKCAEEEIAGGSSMQQREHKWDEHTISFENFCTWLARRAALRMSSETAVPHRVHEVSHSGGAARTVRLTMPSDDRIRTIFDVRGGGITAKQVEKKLSKEVLKEAAAELFPAAHKRRLGRVVEYARDAAFEDVDLINMRDKDELTYRSYLPKDVMSVAQGILRYTIALDNVWDKVSQEVQHRHIQGAKGGSKACCAAAHRAKSGKPSEVMGETSFAEACNVAGYQVRRDEAVRCFHELCQPGKDYISLGQFCSWIAPKISKGNEGDMVQQKRGANRFNRNRFKHSSSDFRKLSGGRGFISVPQARALAAKQPPALAGTHEAMLDAALVVCRIEHGSVEEHVFHQVLQTLEFLRARCGAVARLLAHDDDGEPAQLSSGDFRHCCDLVGHHMSDVQISRQFGKFGMGPEGSVEAKDFYVWYARQQMEHLDDTGFPLLLLPPKSRAMSVAQGLADPVNRCLTWDQVQRGAAELLPEVCVSQ